MSRIASQSWVWNPFAGSPPAEVDDSGYADAVTFEIGQPAPCSADGECGCLTIGETRGVLFSANPAGTITDDYKVVVKGFGLTLPVEIESDDLSFDLPTGTVFAEIETTGFYANTYGTVELWATDPALAVVARRRYRVNP